MEALVVLQEGSWIALDDLVEEENGVLVDKKLVQESMGMVEHNLAEKKLDIYIEGLSVYLGQVAAYWLHSEYLSSFFLLFIHHCHHR